MLKTMATQSCKQTVKRESTNDCSKVLVKKSKLEDISDTKLTDLNYDCLSSILKLLSIDEIFEMLEVHHKFVEPVNRVVRKLSVQNPFTLSDNRFNIYCPTFYRYSIYVSYRHLKYIGHSISKIFIDYEETLEGSVSVIEDSIVEYCTELTELHLTNSRSGPFESSKPSFGNLEVLHLTNCTLGPVFSQFSKWLPKLRTLTMMKCDVLDPSCIRNMGTKMPALEYLHLDNVRKVCLNKRNEEAYHLCNVEEIIRTNCHVKHFKSLSDKKPRRLRIIGKKMEHLETLEIRIDAKHFMTPNSINFKWVKKLVLHITSDESWYPCPVAFEMLEELEVTCNRFIESWLFFARSNRLSKLKFDVLYLQLSSNHLLKISSTWPGLMEVSMYFYNFYDVSVGEIVGFIHSFSNLQRFNAVKCLRVMLKMVDRTKFNEVNLSGEYRLLPETDEYYCSFIRST